MDTWNEPEPITPRTPGETLHELVGFLRWLVGADGSPAVIVPLRSWPHLASEDAERDATERGTGAGARR